MVDKSAWHHNIITSRAVLCKSLVCFLHFQSPCFKGDDHPAVRAPQESFLWITQTRAWFCQTAWSSLVALYHYPLLSISNLIGLGNCMKRAVEDEKRVVWCLPFLYALMIVYINAQLDDMGTSCDPYRTIIRPLFQMLAKTPGSSDDVTYDISSHRTLNWIILPIYLAVSRDHCFL